MKTRYLSFAVMAAAVAATLASCSDGENGNPQIVVPGGSETGGGDNEDEQTAFSIPTYADDYSSISSWANRSQWNLANVHDPSVVYWTDGYYYMWGTDASYGNVHEGHGHFQGKRSKDLVDWEWVPGILGDSNVPSWILEKVNEFLADAGKDPVTSLSLGCWAPCARKVTVDAVEVHDDFVVKNLVEA